MDPLSDVVALLKVRSVLFARLEAAGPWALRFPAYRHVTFGGVIEGSRWLWIEGRAPPLRLEAGDFYLLTDGRPYCLASDPGAPARDGLAVHADHLGEDGVVRFGEGAPRTIGAGGLFVFGDDASPLLESLPPLIHIPGRSPQARPLGAVLTLIGDETEAVRPGAAILAGSLTSLVLVGILRAYLASDARPSGWLGALADPRIGRALKLLHGNIARRWRVEDIALQVSMSRSSFAERFRALVGAPPLDYLIRWRLTVARDVLKTHPQPLAAVARGVGYESETAFSLAFKKAFGVSPGRYRAQAAAEALDIRPPELSAP